MALVIMRNQQDERDLKSLGGYPLCPYSFIAEPTFYGWDHGQKDGSKDRRKEGK